MSASYNALRAKERTPSAFGKAKYGAGSKTDPQPKQKADPLGRLVLAAQYKPQLSHSLKVPLSLVA